MCITTKWFFFDKSEGFRDKLQVLRPQISEIRMVCYITLYNFAIAIKDYRFLNHLRGLLGN